MDLLLRATCFWQPSLSRSHFGYTPHCLIRAKSGNELHGSYKKEQRSPQLTFIPLFNLLSPSQPSYFSALFYGPVPNDILYQII
ncbi:hypothetical protein BT96DRAFT_286031 [Gymnopus androsaceus JB14]|uniref:Uncharacterized protein n=1 Tax=Gymnopus androsaceus JB14 TaxID=1447944 RepID=A0A6A4H4I6_9AGAR|nr:hypothetical protein BT96DRAFT_286031 [Gymnopus androsaceus JB14]